jgi:hypothetical protein
MIALSGATILAGDMEYANAIKLSLEDGEKQQAA